MHEIAPLILAGDGYSLAIAPDAEALKASLLETAGKITQVTSTLEADEARSSVKALAAMRIRVDKSRKAVKEPVLQVGREIDQTAGEFVESITAEEKRLGKLLADHAAEVEAARVKLLREMEAKRQAEEKARREAEAAAAKAAAEAEAARIAEERALWEDSPEAKAEAAAAQAAAAASAAKAAEEQAARASAAQAAPPAPLMPEKVRGVEFERDYEVTDIHALYRFRPSFVKMEERRADILAWLKTIDDMDSIPEPHLCGIRITRRAKVATR